MAVQPFRAAIPDAALADLAARLARVRWPNAPAAAGWDYGAELDYMRELVAYWRDRFDWRAAEAELNRFPQFTAELDGLAVHFIHERGSGPNPLPIILTHGWPGSVLEFLEVIEPLAHPERFGGRAADGFDVIVPSLPGYGFSAAPPGPITPRAVAELWHRLMVDQLGYDRFGAQGGDWGSLVTSWLGLDHGAALVGIHLNMVIMRPDPKADGAPPLDAEERAWLAETRTNMAAEGGYIRIQSTKPQTLAYGLTDSPVGLAGWFVEKFHSWGDTGGDIERRFSKDRLLANIALYWLTGTINSANWMYACVRDRANIELPAGGRVAAPTGIAKFRDGVFDGVFAMPPRRWIERAFDVVHWTDMPAGGHFAAMEEPALFAADVGAFFRGLDV